MRAKNYDDIEIGDQILFQMHDGHIFKVEVESKNEDERSVLCVNNILDFYPNEDDQYIVIE
jgi:hypothetical protein